MKYTFAIAILILGSYAFADQQMKSLSPYWDRVSQYEAVVKSPEVENRITGMINQVKVKGSRTFEVSTDFCVATVELEAQPSGQVGPISYSVKTISNVQCE